jgi:AcrR family transcriptional regulator
MGKLNNISIREQKFAETKLAILRYVLKAITEKPLSEISVKEICDEVLISEATFFNYFSKKTDILIYFIQIWTIDMLWVAKRKYGLTSGLQIIERIFEETGKQMLSQPFIMDEIISFMALSRQEPDFKKLTIAEKLIAFPDYTDIEEVEDDQLNSTISDNLKLAISQGELPPNSDFLSLMTGVTSLFFGLPLLYKGPYTQYIPQTYTQQLKRIWKSYQLEEK